MALAAGARSLGVLFIRSTERADTLRLAADLRGGGGAGADTDPRTAPDPAAGGSAARLRRLVASAVPWALAAVPAVGAVVAAVVLR